MVHKIDSDTNRNWSAGYTHQRIGTGTGGLGNKRTSGDHPNDSIKKIDQNTEKSPGDLRRLAITQTPVRNHQLAQLLKILIKKQGNMEHKSDSDSLCNWFYRKNTQRFGKLTERLKNQRTNG